MKNNANNRPRVLVMTSTFLRWENDTEPPFVYELSRRLGSPFDITVLAPRSPGSAMCEHMGGLRVIRFPYFFRSMETLAMHGGGILSRLKSNPVNYLLVPFFLLGQLIAMIRLIRRKHFDLIHAHWLIPQGLVAVLGITLTRQKIPLLCTSHGGDLFALRGKILQRLKRFIIDRSQSLTVVSSAMKRAITDMGVASDKIQVISMGVDLQTRFIPDPSVARSTSELLFVGRLVEKKGVRLLIEAMPTVRAAHPEAHLTIAGSGPLEDELREQAEQLQISEWVNFLGMVPQSHLPTLYRRAAIAVFPFVVAKSGDQEGLGLVQAEAMGCGCPVIAGDLPAIHDIITSDETGLLVPAGDSKALAQSIIELLDDPKLRQQLAYKAHEKVRGKYDWEIVAGRYTGICNELVENIKNEQNESKKCTGFATNISRLDKALKINCILSEHYEGKEGRLSLLDIGTGNGEIASNLGKFYDVVSVDVTDQRSISDGFTFIQLAEDKLPFLDKSFDIVVSNHVIEHVADADQHLAEISRVLKDKGIVYLATPNRLWPWEVHYNVPFLHYLPIKIFTAFLRSLGKYREDVYLLTWWNLCQKTKKYFSVTIVSDRICKSPLHYHMSCHPIVVKILARIPLTVYKMFTFIHPTLVVLLKKRFFISPKPLQKVPYIE